MKTKNRILAMVAAPAAIPVNPNTAAIIAMIRNVIVQRNMIVSLVMKYFLLKRPK